MITPIGRPKYLLYVILLTAGFMGWLVLPQFPLGRAIASAHAGKLKPFGQNVSGSGLDAARESALQKLYSQFRAGDPFSEEEAYVLGRFGAGNEISELEADIVISRALYELYIKGYQLTPEQQELLDRYKAFVAERGRAIADYKMQLLNRRRAAAAAAPPRTTPLAPPANDQCAGAVVIPDAGPFPFTTGVTADITDATTTGDPPLPSCQPNVSRSIWYKFTPSTTGIYVISACSSDTATTVDDTVMAIYTSTGACAGPFTEIPTSGLSDGCNDDSSCAANAAQSIITTQLNTGTSYYIVVWLFDVLPPPNGSTAVQLKVSLTPTASNDTCSAPIALALNTSVFGRTSFALNDYELSGSACFTGIGQTASTATGRDIVYSFTAPVADNYSFRVSFFTGQNGVLYVASDCPTGTPPLTPTCLGASNRNSVVTNGAEEVLCLPLAASQTVFVFVDETTANPISGSTFRIEVTKCSTETEPNNTPATANFPNCGIEGSISPAADVDFYSLGALVAGSRVFALVDGAAASNSGFDMRITTNTDTLEFDDSDNDVPFGQSAPNVAGTPLTGVPALIRVNQSSAATQSEPYRLYTAIQPPGMGPGNTSATTETEPNNTIATANSAANKYFYGTLSGLDLDVFSFTAAAGDRIFLSVDGDPLRDNTPINPRVELLDSGGAPLLSVDDANATSNTTPSPGTLTGTTPSSPAEGLVFRVATAGTYYARVRLGGAVPGAAGDYLLSISIGCNPAPTAAKLSDFSATRYENGTLLQWRTGHEVDNAGFNVYREEAGQRVRINPELLAGSALVAGPGTALTAGWPYSWADKPLTVNQSVRYWLEDVDLKGQSTWHGPIEPGPASPGKKLSKTTHALLLSALSKQQGRAEIATKPVDRIAEISRANSSEISAQSIGQVNPAGQQAVKISVKQEGWYHVAQPDLATAGLDPKVNPRNLHLFVDGRELPIIVQGEQDGRLDPSDAIEFYGIGLDTPATSTRTYWLVAGSQPGQRINTVQSQGVTGAPGSFPFTVERKDRTLYFASLRNGEKENFFGSLVRGDPVDQTLFVQHLSQVAGEQAQLELVLQGVTLVSHKVKVLLNGTQIGALNFDGQTEGVARLQASQSLLRNGINVITFIAQGGPSDLSLVDYIRLTYRHSYTADNNGLRLTATGGQQVTIDGFTNSALRAMDITDSDAVLEVAGVVRPGKGTYSATITVPGTGQRRLFIFTDQQAKKAAALVSNQPSNWRDSSQAADFVIITQRNLLDSMTPLKELRQSQGYKVAVVDIEDVYDEFSYGNKTPQAIKDFLAYARGNWRIAPAFVMLVGDASVDPKNYLGFGDNDIVPTKLIDTQLMETASDDWLADFDGDGLAEMAVGRLPVRTAREAARIVARLIEFDQTARPEGILLVADEGNDGVDFEARSGDLRSVIPDDQRVEQINRGSLDPVTAKSRLLDAINRGQKVINYDGHGNLDSWRGSLLTSEDVNLLDNRERLSLFVMMTCLNGYFHDAQTDSLAEALIKSENGGAVAVWASSAMTLPSDQGVMDLEMFRRLFDRNNSWTLGEMIQRAKASALNRDVRLTWILLGDPTTRLR